MRMYINVGQVLGLGLTGVALYLWYRQIVDEEKKAGIEHQSLRDTLETMYRQARDR
jgi:hypothetical protein